MTENLEGVCVFVQKQESAGKSWLLAVGVGPQLAWLGNGCGKVTTSEEAPCPPPPPAHHLLLSL